MTAQRHPDGPLVVVGSGLAGWSAVREFRKVNTATPVLMITADAGDFYAKPALSNALVQGKVPAQLVLATGAKAIRVSFMGNATNDVMSVNSLDDYAALS